MRDADERLVDLLDDSLLGVHPAWKIERACFAGHRVMSPPEPCDRCGKTVFLMLPKGRTRPIWLTWGELKDEDSLFPQCTTKRHTCGDGDSWSVEAALFVESAMREWALAGGPDAQ